MQYEYWLATARGVSARKKIALREQFGSAKYIYNNIEETNPEFFRCLNEREAQALVCARKAPFEREYRELAKKGIRFVPYASGEYPQRLRQIPDPPFALYVKGTLPDPGQPTAAIVGARQCTPYGEHAALEYGEALARAGLCIVSGMALGIDGAGQRGALNGGGTACAVLGCGVDVCYPRENFGLYMDIMKNGCVISEQPPGSRPLPGYFPARNRIISALSDVVLVMEAREKSGSLITADLALEQGKDVYALPGPVYSPMSQGCHRLIHQGAGILISPGDFICEIKASYVKITQKSEKTEKTLATNENILYSFLDFTPKCVDQLAKESGLTAKEVLERVAELQLTGAAREISKNYYARI